MIRPMLACNITRDDFHLLRFPLFVQPKYDGIRCIVKDGKAYSRTGKLLPNRYLQHKLSRIAEEYYILDGEITIKNKSFNDIQSCVMKVEGEFSFNYSIFDQISADKFKYRWKEVLELSVDCSICLEVRSIDDLEIIIKDFTYRYSPEGIILRSPEGLYKHGRSTIKEQYLLKYKVFQDDEAKIISVIPMNANLNPIEYNEVGYAKRSSNKDGMVELESVGAFVCEVLTGPFKGKTIKIGSLRLTQEERIKYFKHLPIGKIVVFQYQLHGSKELPRILTMKGFKENL